MSTIYRNPWVISVIIIILLAGSWWYFSRPNDSASPVSSTSAVTKGTLVTSVNGSGTVIAKIQSDVTTSSAGRIEKLYVTNGQEVTADQPLLEIKSLATSEEIAKAYASLLSAQNSVASAQQAVTEAQQNEQIEQTNLASSQLAYEQSKLVANQAVINADKSVINAAITQEAADTDLENVSAERTSQSADIDVETAKLSGQENVKKAEAALTQAEYDAQSAVQKTSLAQAALNAANASLSASRLSYQSVTNQTLTAPVSGRIMNFSLVTGGTVGSQNNSDTESGTSAKNLFSIVNMDSLRAQILINEVDISSIALGQPATLTFDALSDKKITGTVSNIDTLGTTTSGVTTYNVEIALDQLDESIRPGMSVTADIITAKEDNVLIVPSGAIQYQNEQAFVTVLQDNIPVATEVTVGISNEVSSEIKSGLKENDLIITNNSANTSGGSFSNQSRSGNPSSVRGFTTTFQGAPPRGL